MNEKEESVIKVSGSSCLTGQLVYIEKKKRVVKEEGVNFRCTKKQKEEISKAAKEAGISKSKYIVNKCFPEKEEKRKTVTALRKRQEFVNQINSKLSKCNSFTYAEFIKQLSDMVKAEEDDIHADVGKLRT